MLLPPPDRYRPDIDGLRAVAVLAVVAFHAFPTAVHGGFVGVDIFFVISGFLITGIIEREIGEERFSLAAFYARRVRRIFPALIVVLGAVLIPGWFWMLPGAYAQLGSDVFASAAFAANIALWLQSGYFDVEAANKPLLHLWSLGIEEQFYLLWPLVLLLATRLRLGLIRVAIALALVSFAFNVALIASHSVATFYLPFTRAWELLAGGVLAGAWNGIDQARVASDRRAAAGAVLIAVAIVVLTPTRAFPGWWAVLPVAGSALLLSAPQAWGCQKLLASLPMVWVGQISYPLYLWHWPLLVFFAMIKFTPLTLADRALTVLLSIALAWATYRFVEIPFRFGRPRPFKVASLAGAMALTAFAGAVVLRNAGLDFRLPEDIRSLAHATIQGKKWRLGECLIDLSSQSAFAESCVDHDRRPLLIVWGDSTAGALMPGLRKAQETRDFGIAQFTSSACIPAINADTSPAGPNCRAINDKVLQLARQLKADIVLLTGIYLDHQVMETVAALKRDTSARIVVLGPVPFWKRGLPNEVLHYYILHHSLIPEHYGVGLPDRYDAWLRTELVPAGAEFISARDVLCTKEGCLTRLGEKSGDLSASDTTHLTEKGSVFLISAIIDRLLVGPSQPTSNMKF